MLLALFGGFALVFGFGVPDSWVYGLIGFSFLAISEIRVFVSTALDERHLPNDNSSIV